MGSGLAGKWVAKARNAYSDMPKSDGRYDTYLPGGKPWLNLSGAILATPSSATLT